MYLAGVPCWASSAPTALPGKCQPQGPSCPCGSGTHRANWRRSSAPSRGDDRGSKGRDHVGTMGFRAAEGGLRLASLFCRVLSWTGTQRVLQPSAMGTWPPLPMYIVCVRVSVHMCVHVYTCIYVHTHVCDLLSMTQIQNEAVSDSAPLVTPDWSQARGEAQCCKASIRHREILLFSTWWRGKRAETLCMGEICLPVHHKGNQLTDQGRQRSDGPGARVCVWAQGSDAHRLLP